MRSNAITTGLILVAVVLAGCAGSPGVATSPTNGTDDGGTATTADRGTSAADGGTVEFYVSDERNDIDDFRHLNVTITRVGFERSGENGGGWKEFEVDDVTVDLTELQGEKATFVESYGVPNGTYAKTFVYVDEVNATLENGESVRVKLPSEKLHVNREFTVGDGETVSFVFDVTVHEAGKSGKYVLEPVVGESGTDVAIDETGNRSGNETSTTTTADSETTQGTTTARTTTTTTETTRTTTTTEREGNRTTTTAGTTTTQSDYELHFFGDLAPGENVTVEVEYKLTPVEDATVLVDGNVAGNTGSNGRASFTVPDVDTLHVVVQTDDGSVEFDVDVGNRTTTTAGTAGSLR